MNNNLQQTIKRTAQNLETIGGIMVTFGIYGRQEDIYEEQMEWFGRHMGEQLGRAVKDAPREQQQHPDAELIAACDKSLRIERQYQAAHDALGGEDMEPDDPAHELLEPIRSPLDNKSRSAVLSVALGCRWEALRVRLDHRHPAVGSSPISRMNRF